MRSTSTRRKAAFQPKPKFREPIAQRNNTDRTETKVETILWTIIIGFIAGVIAKFITPGSNKQSGFILTAILGIVGAFLATWIGQAMGWYGPNEGAGLIGAVVGAIIVLVIWGMIATRQSARRI